jgi:hypothetical protein
VETKPGVGYAILLPQVEEYGAPSGPFGAEPSFKVVHRVFVCRIGAIEE